MHRATPPGPAASWLRYHANASNNAVIAEPGWRPLTWRSRPVQDQILGVSVVGQRVYAVGAGAAHAVYAFNRATGQLTWRRVLDNIVMTQPLVVGNRIFVGSGNNYMRANPVRDWSSVLRGTGFNALYALDAATGAVLWRRPLAGEAMPTPVYRAGLLYWVTGDRRFLAIDAATGQIAWSLRLPSYMSMSSPVPDGNLLIFGGAHPYAEYAVDIAARTVAWQHVFATYKGVPVTGGVDDCSAAVSGPMVYCTATTSPVAVPLGGSPIGQFVWALDTRTGTLRWQHDTGAGKLPNNFAAGVPTALGGVVYVTSPGNRGVQALDAQTGRLLWHTTLPAMANAAPALDGVNLFLTDDVGTLYQLDARTGGVRHRMHLGGSIHNLGLVLAGGTLFVPNAKGGLVYAIPERVMTMASTVDVAPPLGTVVGQSRGPSGS